MDTRHPTCAYSGPHMINSYMHFLACIARYAKSILHNNDYLAQMLGFCTFFCAVRFELYTTNSHDFNHKLSFKVVL